MSKYIPGNQKHLTLDDRKYIERSLNQGCSFKEIAKYLCKDPATIPKEVRLRRLSDWYHKGTFYNAHNFCAHRYHCKKTNACGMIILCGIKCTSCPACNQTCPDFLRERAVWIRLLMSATAAQKLSTSAPSPINTAMMQSSLTGNTGSASMIPVPASASQSMNSGRRIWSSPH